jgi:hypothetical protein
MSPLGGDPLPAPKCRYLTYLTGIKGFSHHCTRRGHCSHGAGRRPAASLDGC